MSDLPRIIILGLPKSGRKTLLQGLSRYLDIDYQNANQIQSVGNVELNIYQGEIFTKYYKAIIEFCFCSGDNSMLGDRELKHILSENCKGVIFLYRSVDTTALDILINWNKSIMAIEENLEIKLVVGSFSDIQNNSSSKNITSIRSWCIDSCYEFIPANLRIPHQSWKSADKEGVARVIEALECVMWSNMDTTQRRTIERVIDESLIMNSKEFDECACCHKSRTVDKSPLYLCSRCRTISYCSRDCQVKDWVNHKSLCNQLSGVDKSIRGKEETKMNDMEKKIVSSLPTPPRDQNEEQFESFQKLMQECKNTKEQAKVLPDEERKKRAAMMAAKLMKEFGFDDEGDAEGILEDCNHEV